MRRRPRRRRRPAGRAGSGRCPAACWRARLERSRRAARRRRRLRCRPRRGAGRGGVQREQRGGAGPRRPCGRPAPADADRRGRSAGRSGRPRPAWSAYPAKTAGGRAPGGRACHSSWRSAAQPAGVGVRVGEADHRLAPTMPAGGVDHGRSRPAAPPAASLSWSSTPPPPGSATRSGNWPKIDSALAVQRLDAGHALAGQHQVDAVRAALAGQLLQQVGGFPGERVVAGEQHVELVDDGDDPGQRRVAVRRAGRRAW